MTTHDQLFSEIGEMDFDFSKTTPQPKTLKESHKLIERLWKCCVLFEETLLKLKEQASISSSNSSLPPSTDSIKRKAEKRKEQDAWRKRTLMYWKRKRQGAQPGHKGVGRALVSVSEVDEIIPCYPNTTCDVCSGTVKIKKVQQRKQVFDLPVGALYVTEYQIYGGSCLQCKKTHLGKLPEGITRGILGSTALAKIATLTGKYRLSKREVKEFLFDFFKLKICIGTISKAEHIVSQSLEKSTEQIGKAVTKQDHLNVDETGHYHKGELEWLWVATNEQLTYFKIYQHRNQNCAKALIGEDFSGTVITDRYGAYNWLSKNQRQYCWAHLKRDFKKIAERMDAQESVIGLSLLSNLTAIIYHWHSIRNATINTSHTLSMRNAIKDLYGNLRKGRKLAGTKTAKFCTKLIHERKSLWHFLHRDKISATNNLAERQLRHAVIWRKKCYGTQSDRGIGFVERILTVFKTCQQRNRELIEFIDQSVQSRWYNKSPPSLIH